MFFIFFFCDYESKNQESSGEKDYFQKAIGKEACKIGGEKACCCVEKIDNKLLVIIFGNH